MFGVGTGEILLILVIAMLVVGPERMVTFARQLGQWIAKFRQETDSVTAEFREALSLDPEESESATEATAQAGPGQDDGEHARAQAAPPQATSATPVAQTGPVMGQRQDGISPFADSERSETPWPADELSSVPSAEPGVDSEVIALDVARMGANGDELEPTLLQEPQVILDESEPEETSSDGENKG
ncbi:MAG: twin-arginine translocase TatA/TatE family subunit [Anaerolineae bacterium]|nr:twin-arginine translocase TatA/TatE family subunit [Anaerolineae bacterium]